MSSVFEFENTAQRKTVVENFDGAPVSWAKVYTENAIHEGFSVLPTTTHDTLGDKIFLGDRLPKSLGSGGVNLYFLAAVDGTQAEYESAKRVDVVTTVSEAEKERLLDIFPDLSDNQIFVDGFPVYRPEQIALLKTSTQEVRKEGVVFVGRTALDKGPELELALAKRMRQAGIAVSHLSADRNSIGNELRELGVSVHENVSGDAYLRALSSYQAVVNSSPRESLFVSGIEASALGVPVFAPDVAQTGIREWNSADRMYNPEDIDQLVDSVKNILESNVDEVTIPDVSRYTAGAYFSRIAQRMGENNE